MRLLEPRIVLTSVAAPHAPLLGPVSAAAHPHFEAAIAELVNETDLFDEPDGVMQRQHIDERRQAQSLRPLGHGSKIDGLVGRQTQGRMVVLGNMVAVEAGGIRGGGKLQPFLVLLSLSDIVSSLDMIENTEAHQPFSLSCLSPPDGPGGGANG